MRRDHDALGSERAVRDVARVLVEHRHGGHELADEKQRGVDVERQVVALGDRQNLRQPGARRVLVHDRETIGAVGHPIDAAHSSVIRMAEVREASDAFAERELERGDTGQLGAKAEHFERFAPGLVDEPESDRRDRLETRARWALAERARA